MKVKSNLKNFPDYFYDIESKKVYNITLSKVVLPSNPSSKTLRWKMKNSKTGWAFFSEKTLLPFYKEYIQSPIFETPCVSVIIPKTNTRKEKRLVFGVGVNDYQDTVVPEGKILRSYSVWLDMLRRSYCNKRQEEKPYLKGNTVCTEWLTFSCFKTWYDERYFTDCQIDKDLKVKGNKHYSPENCTLIPRSLNLLYRSVNSEKFRHIIESPRGFTVKLKLDSKTYTVGTYNIFQDAVHARDLSKSILYKNYLSSLKGCYGKEVDNLLDKLTNELEETLLANLKYETLVKNLYVKKLLKDDFM
tara:strand:+ start:7205 stop:8110 length:906 start_codon:yes stop_codon:yes gene_type:complete